MSASRPPDDTPTRQGFDNHHNALTCPQCNPTYDSHIGAFTAAEARGLARLLRVENTELRAEVSRLREALDRLVLETAVVQSWLSDDIHTFESDKIIDNICRHIQRARESVKSQAQAEAEADVSRLQQENALLRRSLEMLTKDFENRGR